MSYNCIYSFDKAFSIIETTEKYGTIHKYYAFTMVKDSVDVGDYFFKDFVLNKFDNKISGKEILSKCIKNVEGFSNSLKTGLKLEDKWLIESLLRFYNFNTKEVSLSEFVEMICQIIDVQLDNKTKLFWMLQ